MLITLAGVCLLAWAIHADRLWFERHVFTIYCASSTSDVWLVRGLRVAGAIAGVLALWAAPALARWVGRGRARDRLAAGARVGVAVLLAVLVAEAILRQLTIGEQPPLGRADLPLARPHPRYGWELIPSQTRSVVIGDRRVEYVVNAQGNRVARADERIDPMRATLVIGGESIGFGYGLPWEETFFAQLAGRFGLQVINLAVPGYGTDQAYLRLTDTIGGLDHLAAAVIVFVPNQIRRTQLIWRPRLALVPGGRLELVAPAHHFSLRLARLWRDEPYHGDDALKLTAAVLRATARALEARGAVPLFVATNYGPRCLDDDGGPPWVLRELFDRQNLLYVRVDIARGECLPLPGDFHPDARASERIAEKVAAILEERSRGLRCPLRR